MHEKLDKILHQPIRTKIIAYLATKKNAVYTTLMIIINGQDF